jgi:hypothetical protein
MTKETGRLHLLKCNGSDSWFAFETGKEEILEAREPCYYEIGVHSPKTFKYLGVGYYCELDDDAGVQYLQWITGDKSPWRSLLIDPIEIIKDEKKIRGFFVGPETLKKANKKFLMNFLIASRAFNEFEDHIRFWYEAVKEGIDPARAYVYAKDFVYNGKRLEYRGVENDNHWAWCGDPDWEAIKESKPHVRSAYNTLLFAKSKLGHGDPRKWLGDNKYKDYVGYYGVEISRENLKEMDKKFK